MLDNLIQLVRLNHFIKKSYLNFARGRIVFVSWQNPHTNEVVNRKLYLSFVSYKIAK